MYSKKYQEKIQIMAKNSNDNRGRKETKFKSFTQRGLTISRHLNTKKKRKDFFSFKEQGTDRIRRNRVFRFKMRKK